MPYSVLSCFPFKPLHDRKAGPDVVKVEDAEQIMIGIILILASGHLIVIQSWWLLRPLNNFEDWLAVEQQADAELGPFQKVVRILAVEF